MRTVESSPYLESDDEYGKFISLLSSYNRKHPITDSGD